MIITKLQLTAVENQQETNQQDLLDLELSLETEDKDVSQNKETDNRRE
jgi:hypothetical protein